MLLAPAVVEAWTKLCSHKVDAVRFATLSALHTVLAAGAAMENASGLSSILCKMVQGATKKASEHADGVGAWACLLQLMGSSKAVSDEVAKAKLWESVLKPDSFLLGAAPFQRASVEELLCKHEVAAVVMEGVMGNCGFVPPSKEFL